MKKSEIDYLKGTVRSWLSTDTPRTQKELEDLTGIDRRDVRRLIRELRIDGVKICSGNAGYWIWNGQDESWHRTKLTIIAKGTSTYKLVNAILRAEKNEGQMSFFEEVSA